MDLKEKSKKLNLSITRLSNLDNVDKAELEQVIKFGEKAIGRLESLVDEVLAPLIKAKKELYKTQNPDSVNEFLVKIVTDIYDELDEAKNMLYRFEKLRHNFNSEIEPILSKYYTYDEIWEWGEIIDSAYMSRAASYEGIETFIPKIEAFIDAKYNKNTNENLDFIEVKNYINEAIEDLRTTKKDLQSVKANFLQLSGIKGLTNISGSKLSTENRKNEFDNKIKKIEDLVASSRIDIALDELEQLCFYNYPEIVKDVILLQSQYSKNNRDFYSGIDHDKITPNRINFGILEIVKEIRKREDHA